MDFTTLLSPATSSGKGQTTRSFFICTIVSSVDQIGTHQLSLDDPIRIGEGEAIHLQNGIERGSSPHDPLPFRTGDMVSWREHLHCRVISPHGAQSQSHIPLNSSHQRACCPMGSGVLHSQRRVEWLVRIRKRLPRRYCLKYLQKCTTASNSHLLTQ